MSKKLYIFLLIFLFIVAGLVRGMFGDTSWAGWVVGMIILFGGAYFLAVERDKSRPKQKDENDKIADSTDKDSNMVNSTDSTAP